MRCCSQLNDSISD